MAYTPHGHFVPESSTKDIEPRIKLNCGGPGVCSDCTEESVKITGVPVKGFVSPAYSVNGDGERLIGIAHIVDGRVLIFHDEPDRKQALYGGLTFHEVENISDKDFFEWMGVHFRNKTITPSILSIITQKRGAKK